MKQIVVGETVNQSLCDWVASKAGGSWLPGEGHAIGLAEDGKLIACVVYDHWNGKSLYAHIAAEPGAFWTTKAYLKRIFSYPFLFVGCHKLIGLVGGEGKAINSLVSDFGFVCEATLHDAHPAGALTIWSMTRDQCRWIDWRPRGKRLSTAT